MKKGLISSVLVVLAMVLLTGCEKTLLEGEGVETEADGNVVLKLSVYERIPFGTRSVQDISQLCTRVNVVFFQNGTKVKTVTQKPGDPSFGTISLTLDEGVYQVVVIGHSSSGSATISSAEKVTFPSNLVSDTFYYEGDLTVTSSQSSYDLQLERAVAMFRLELTDGLPSNAAKIRFYYTGGSSTFNPSTGFGCVNSRQTVMMTPEGNQSVFEVYTFPHEMNDVLKMTITVYNANEDILAEEVLEQVPVTLNEITVYRGSLFGGNGGGNNGGSSSSSGLHLTADGEWAGISTYSF